MEFTSDSLMYDEADSHFILFFYVTFLKFINKFIDYDIYSVSVLTDYNIQRKSFRFVICIFLVKN